MIKLIRNEVIKLIHQKKLYFLLLVMFLMTALAAVAYKDLRVDILQNTVKGQKILGENRELIKNIDYLNFAKLVSKDFLFKPFIPIYLIFLSIIVTSIFSDDLLSGNLKFTLLSKVSKEKLISSKIIFTLLLLTFIALANLIINLLVGFIAFGGTERGIADFANVLSIYMLSIPPAGAFSIIILLVSSIFKNSTATMISFIVLSILINIVDLLTKSKFISPIGIMAILSSDTVGKISIVQVIVPLVYIGVTAIIFIASFKKSDVVY